MRVRFEECVFDDGSRELLLRGRRVHLTVKAFELLRLLLRERPRALRKGEIFDCLWPEKLVSDVTLAALIHEVRHAIGDAAGAPRLVRTVRGYGYAFCGETLGFEDDGIAWNDRPVALFRLVCGPMELGLREGENVIGREPSSVVLLDCSLVAPRHARIVVRGWTAVLEDLGSRRATCLNGVPIDSPRRLRDGDHIRVGSVTMTLRAFLPGRSANMAEAQGAEAPRRRRTGRAIGSVPSDAEDPPRRPLE